MSDEGFHEIQLNGKQLVFLFMAATVVAVVIFLCGVMVGRGVPMRAGSAADDPELASLDPTAALQGPQAEPAVASAGSGPATAPEILTYPTFLEDPNPPEETLAPAVAKPAPVAPRPLPVPGAPSLAAASRPVATPPASTAAKPPAVAPVPPPRAAPRPVAAAPAIVTPVPAAEDVTPAEPSGAGFVVQVAAVRQRAEANAIASRLTAKGYPAFVTAAGANFRVRVGKYNERREAESVAGRLEKEERFKSWITR